jgi:hypothetical protein
MDLCESLAGVQALRGLPVDEFVCSREAEGMRELRACLRLLMNEVVANRRDVEGERGLYAVLSVGRVKKRAQNARG